ncbi:MAG: hypothetical protein AAF581_08485 [Planctomycetota bacterium]
MCLRHKVLFLTCMLMLVLLLPHGAAAQNLILNGNFADTTGAPWTFTNQSMNGCVDYSTMSAVITGGDDNMSSATSTWIEQQFTMNAGETGTISFDWSYTSTDDPGFDACVFDVWDAATNASAIGGPVTLSDTTGQSGLVQMTFTGSGSFVVRLGTNSEDNILGPGVSTFDNVLVMGPTGPSFRRGDVDGDGSLSIPDAVVLLNHLFPLVTPTQILCADAADANDDGIHTLTDAVAILTALFAVPSVSLPGPVACGHDVVTDPLDCQSYPGC